MLALWSLSPFASDVRRQSESNHHLDSSGREESVYDMAAQERHLLAEARGMTPTGFRPVTPEEFAAFMEKRPDLIVYPGEVMRRKYHLWYEDRGTPTWDTLIAVLDVETGQEFLRANPMDVESAA